MSFLIDSGSSKKKNSFTFLFVNGHLKLMLTIKKLRLLYLKAMHDHPDALWIF